MGQVLWLVGDLSGTGRGQVAFGAWFHGGGALTQPQHALPFRLVVLPMALVDVAVVVVHASPPAALVVTPLTLVILLGSEKLDPIALKAGRCPTICQLSHLSLLVPAFLAEVKEF